MLVIPHRFKKIGVHNLVVHRISSDILLVLGLKKVEKHWARATQVYASSTALAYGYRQLSLLLLAYAGSSLADFSTMKMEVIRSSEKSVPFTGSPWRHIQKHSILHSQRCENLKSYTVRE
jgi:hypothetical protein